MKLFVCLCIMALGIVLCSARNVPCAGCQLRDSIDEEEVNNQLKGVLTETEFKKVKRVTKVTLRGKLHIVEFKDYYGGTCEVKFKVDGTEVDTLNRPFVCKDGDGYQVEHLRDSQHRTK